jgi:hypothetical protein
MPNTLTPYYTPRVIAIQNATTFPTANNGGATFLFVLVDLDASIPQQPTGAWRLDDSGNLIFYLDNDISADLPNNYQTCLLPVYQYPNMPTTGTLPTVTLQPKNRPASTGSVVQSKLHSQQDYICRPFILQSLTVKDTYFLGAMADFKNNSTMKGTLTPNTNSKLITIDTVPITGTVNPIITNTMVSPIQISTTANSFTTIEVSGHPGVSAQFDWAIPAYNQA